MSRPRIFSLILTRVSPSGNELTTASPSGAPIDLQILSARSRCADPENIFISRLNGVIARRKGTESVNPKSRFASRPSSAAIYRVKRTTRRAFHGTVPRLARSSPGLLSTEPPGHPGTESKVERLHSRILPHKVPDRDQPLFIDFLHRDVDRQGVDWLMRADRSDFVCHQSQMLSSRLSILPVIDHDLSFINLLCCLRKHLIPDHDFH